ncbi:MAG: type II toxin-antitoxin system PemK/MazF family toxin [Actinobacteria bacterium]|nr:type II toxin-antitoxin system PemK/MazF family toxin [Actinomycetota bacterium]MBW3647324.1 type II toxin-antitoxin system PemK/MazF family toxin [Actinomycetota bacterium]
MLTSGDVVTVVLGPLDAPRGGLPAPAVVVTAQRLLDASPSVVHVVPLTSTRRGFGSEADIDADQHNGLLHDSSAQCQHAGAVAPGRLDIPLGNVGGASLAEVREVLGLILDLPT